MTTTTLDVQQGTAIVTECLLRNGCAQNVAESVAKVIVAAEADGAMSHGFFRVPGYVASLRSGKVNGRATPIVSKTATGVLTVNGAGGFAPPALAAARSTFAEMTRSQGICALAMVNIYHFSALWTDLEEICREGLCGLAFTCYLPFVAPAGGTKPLFGTNPMAFGWPRRNALPMIFDQASSVVARGEVMLAARDGHQVQLGVGIGPDGRQTTDPNEILKGAMLTFGGYKGSAIALMVELLAGALIKEQFSYEAGLSDNKDGGPPRGGELIIAMDPMVIGDQTVLDHAEELFAKVTEQPGARLPADRRYVNRHTSAKEGLKINNEVLERIRELSAG